MTMISIYLKKISFIVDIFIF